MRNRVGWLVLLLCLSPLVLAQADGGYYAVREGKGVEGVGMLGENIAAVKKAWGEADRVAKEDMYITDLFYEYHHRGALFATDKTGTIRQITLYSNTGHTEQFHQTGLAWMNPSAIYQTFRGVTSKGLQFKDHMTPEDVYAVYGRPEASIPLGTQVKSKLEEGKSLIVDMGKAGSTIYYPGLGVSFQVFDGMIESCTITGFGSGQ